MTVAVTGGNERTLTAAGVDFEKSYTFSPSHADYYPGAAYMTIKLLFDRKTSVILGAQIIGRQGVDKRIDVLAAAIRARMKVQDLAELELAYAPPFGSAKDPVNIAGYVASNIQNGSMRIFHWHDADRIDLSRSILLDVRTEAEFKKGSLTGAINIPLDSLRDRLDELDRNKPVFVFCQVGLRAI